MTISTYLTMKIGQVVEAGQSLEGDILNHISFETFPPQPLDLF